MLASATGANIVTDVKIKKPTPFTGKREAANLFLMELALYFVSMPSVFNNDQAKVTFAMSYMTEGVAAEWKENYCMS